ncbi:ZIP family metal transporter [Desulfosarcina ovata]|nr:ZIP family metal transporter [Desulfosarcina ovata]
MSPESMLVALSTVGPVIGSAIGVWKRPTMHYIHSMLYFAAGIMLSISFVDLIPESIHLGSKLICLVGLMMGALLMGTIDRLFPHVHECAVCGEEVCHLGRTANFLILAIFLHNFPEGMAIAVGATTDISDSLVIALGIAVHNIPEGVCTSAPYYFTYGNRLKSFVLSSLSALPIAIGYIFARYIVEQISTSTMSLLVGSTAGVMIYISVNELMPAGRGHKKGLSITAFAGGFVSIILLGLIIR